MKTAKEFIKDKGNISYKDSEWYLLEDAVEELMIEFAQYHVNKALRAVEGVSFEKLDWIDEYDFSKGVSHVSTTIEDEVSIEGIYSNDNIR